MKPGWLDGIVLREARSNRIREVGSPIPLQQHQRQPQREERTQDDDAHEAHRAEGLATADLGPVMLLHTWDLSLGHQ